MPKQNYYQFFGLNDFENDPVKIKQAYRSMALKWHPDRHQQDKDHAEHMMKQVNEVFWILSKHKDEYDQHIGRRNAESTRSRSQRSSTYGERWETWYKAYTNGDFGTKTREEARKKEWTPNDHPRGNRRVGETSLYSQSQAIDILKTWTWDEFTTAKNAINRRREQKRNGST